MTTSELRQQIIDIINQKDTRAFEEALYEFDDEVRLVEARHVGESRWSQIKENIYSVSVSDDTTDVLFFGVTFSEPSTEYQEFDSDESEAYAVVPERKTVTVYRKA